MQPWQRQTARREHLLQVLRLGTVLLSGQLLLVQALVQVVDQEVLVLLLALQVLRQAVRRIGLPACCNACSAA